MSVQDEGARSHTPRGRTGGFFRRGDVETRRALAMRSSFMNTCHSNKQRAKTGRAELSELYLGCEQCLVNLSLVNIQLTGGPASLGAGPPASQLFQCCVSLIR